MDRCVYCGATTNGVYEGKPVCIDCKDDMDDEREEE
jgi:hypothetical protein